MGNSRKYTRMKGFGKCTLMLGGSSYKAIIQDFSLGGALVQMFDEVPNGLQVGEECSLTLSSDSNVSLTKHFCRVARNDSANLGIQFLTSPIS